jgi:subtilisin-like proprotein convertase family protein
MFSTLRSWLGRPARTRTAPKHARTRLGCEALEDRAVPAGLPPAVLISGAAQVGEAHVYTLDLTAVDPEGDTVESWTINWGDGNVETIEGNPSSVTHTYADGAGYLVNVSASAVVDGETFQANVSAVGTGRTVFREASTAAGAQPRFMTFGRDADGDGVGDFYVSHEDQASSKVNVYSGADGSFIRTLMAASDGLNRPLGLEFGPDGNLYVCSAWNGQVLQYNWDTQTVEVFAGATQAINSPTPMTFGPNGDLYLADAGGLVWRFDGDTGQQVGSTAFAVAPSRLADLKFGPDGNLYASTGYNPSTDQRDNRILRFDGSTGELLGALVTEGSGGLKNPGALAFGADGDLFVVSRDNKSVLRYDGTSGAFLGAIAGGLDDPLGMTFGPGGDLFVADRVFLSVNPTTIDAFLSIVRYEGPLSGTDSTALELAVLDAVTSTYSSSPNASIPSDLKTYSWTMSVADSGPVLGLKVNLGISHPKPSELRAWLVSPSGTRVELPQTAITGTTVSLQQFNYEPTQGTWTLQIRDGVKANKGTLNNWSLEITRGVGPTLPELSVSDTSVVEGNAGTTTQLAFTVTRSGDTTQAVSVDYATGGGTATAGTDYEAASGTLSFAPGQTSQVVYVTVYGDNAAEPNETVYLTLSNPTAGATIADGLGVGTIINDDPGISINDVSKAEGRNGTTLFTFTVSLSAPPVSTVTVNWATANGTATAGSDYKAASGTLTFAPGETTKTITIEVYGDRTKEPDETFFINLFGAVGADILDDLGIGTILNDD